MEVTCWRGVFCVTAAHVCVRLSQDAGWFTATPWKFSVSVDTAERLFSWCVTAERLWALKILQFCSDNFVLMSDVSGWGKFTNYPEQSSFHSLSFLISWRVKYCTSNTINTCRESPPVEYSPLEFTLTQNYLCEHHMASTEIIQLQFLGASQRYNKQLHVSNVKSASKNHCHDSRQQLSLFQSVSCHVGKATPVQTTRLFHLIKT